MDTGFFMDASKIRFFTIFLSFFSHLSLESLEFNKGKQEKHNVVLCRVVFDGHISLALLRYNLENVRSEWASLKHID